MVHIWEEGDDDGPKSVAADNGSDYSRSENKDSPPPIDQRCFGNDNTMQKWYEACQLEKSPHFTAFTSSASVVSVLQVTSILSLSRNTVARLRAALFSKHEGRIKY